MPFPFSSDLLEALDRLHVINTQQWEAEDRVRNSDDSEIPIVKREIDALNRSRHVQIEQVDQLLFPKWRGDEETPPLTETIGSAFDRLSVLTLRILHAGLLDGDGAGAAKRIAVLQRQHEDMVWSIMVASDDLVSGRRRAPLPERIKLYGKPSR